MYCTHAHRQTHEHTRRPPSTPSGTCSHARVLPRSLQFTPKRECLPTLRHPALAHAWKHACTHADAYTRTISHNHINTFLHSHVHTHTHKNILQNEFTHARAYARWSDIHFSVDLPLEHGSPRKTAPYILLTLGRRKSNPVSCDQRSRWCMESNIGFKLYKCGRLQMMTFGVVGVGVKHVGVLQTA